MLDRLTAIHVETAAQAQQLQNAMRRIKPSQAAETFALLTSPRKDEREEGVRRVKEWAAVSESKA